MGTDAETAIDVRPFQVDPPLMGFTLRQPTRGQSHY
jgi:hypothetical protein